MYLACASFFALASLDALMKWNPAFTSYLYIAIALSQGVAFGTMFPAFNTLFVNLAPNSQRGTATSTYLTSWDVGIGIGLMIGGSIAQEFGGFNHAYLFGACLTVLSTFFFLSSRLDRISTGTNCGKKRVIVPKILYNYRCFRFLFHFQFAH